MRSLVAESLRREGREKLRALSAEERLRLAFRLGEDDLNLLVSAQG